jgi:uncharacterized protein YwqG
MDKILIKKLDQLSLEAIHLVGTKENVFTRIGGQPLAGKNFSWPKWNNQSLSFIMQIKLSEIVSSLQTELFPQKGLLYVFYNKEQSTWGFDPKDIGSWNIFYEPEHDDLSIIPNPPDLEDYKYNEKKLKSKLIKTYPSWEDEKVKALNLPDKQIGQYISSVYCGKPAHQIFGIANSMQSPDMDLQCQFASNGLYCGDGNWFDDPRAKELEKNKSDWILLLQIDSDDDTGMMWGDGGMLYFWIKKDDLVKLNFENVWMILQCG